MRVRLRSLAVDMGALRESKPYRRLWLGQLISLVGRQITTVAVPYQVYLLTGSAFAVGAIGLAQAVPLITMSLWAGVIADRVDRRKILLVTQVGLAACSVLLALGALMGRPPLVAIYLVVALAAMVRLTSPGPAIFRQRRFGQGGVPFTMYKLRTMTVNPGGSDLTAKADPRVTRLGRRLRSSSLDELPQLLNVLLGDTIYSDTEVGSKLANGQFQEVIDIEAK